MRNNLWQFFVDGFFLANQNLDLLLIGFLLSIINFLAVLFPHLGSSGYFVLFSLFFVFLSLAFGLSVPFFMIQKQQNKKLIPKELVTFTLKSLKRIILPGILIFIALILVLTIIMFASIIFIQPSKEQIRILFHDSGFFWHSLLFLVVFVVTFFEFTPFYFSLENQNLFKALRNSFKASFRNLPFILCIALVFLLMIVPSIFLPVEFRLHKVISMTINHYLGLIISATCLLYYQKVLKKDQ